MINIYEVECKVYAKKDILTKYAISNVRSFIDLSFTKNEKMEEFHESNNHRGKGYSFDMLYPFVLRSDKYEEDNFYKFRIRTSNYELAQLFFSKLEHIETGSLKGLKTKIKKVNTNRIIEKIVAVTPCIVVTDEKAYWKDNHGIDFLEKRIIGNTNKKLLTDTYDTHKFFSGLEILNKVPISTIVAKTKDERDIVYPGDKIMLHINPDKKSQEMAWRVISDGLLEKNARGYGFVGYRCY